jgi:hypothetical protein
VVLILIAHRLVDCQLCDIQVRMPGRIRLAKRTAFL